MGGIRTSWTFPPVYGTVNYLYYLCCVLLLYIGTFDKDKDIGKLKKLKIKIKILLEFYSLILILPCFKKLIIFYQVIQEPVQNQLV